MTPVVGQIYRVKNEERCPAFRTNHGKYIKIKSFDDYLRYHILDENYNPIGGCSFCFDSNDLLPLEKTLNDLEEGDVVVDDDGDEKIVLFVLKPGLYVMSHTNLENRSDLIYTSYELEENGWEIVQETEVREMTVAEVEKLVGKKVKIVKEKN